MLNLPTFSLLQMRLIIVLAAVLGLAVAVVLGEEQVTSLADVEVELDDEGRLDVARLLEGLFGEFGD